MTSDTLKKTVSRAYHWDIMQLETRLFFITFWTMMNEVKFKRIPVPRGVNFSHWGDCQSMIKKVASSKSVSPEVFDNTYIQMFDWSPLDPGLHQ